MHGTNFDERDGLPSMRLSVCPGSTLRLARTLGKEHVQAVVGETFSHRGLTLAGANIAEDREAYIASLWPLARLAAWRYSDTSHPFLRREDLLQEAVEALLVAWEKYHGKKGPGELRRLGSLAVFNRIRRVRNQAWKSGEGDVLWLDLDAPTAGGGGTLGDSLGTADLEDSYFWFALEELERSLSDLGRMVLGEILAPGAETLRAIRRLWTEGPGNRWLQIRLAAVAEGLGVSSTEVSEALRDLRRESRKIFGGEILAGSYSRVEGKNIQSGFRPQTGGRAMTEKATKTTFMPEGDLALLMGLETPDGKQGAETAPPAPAGTEQTADPKGGETVMAPKATAKKTAAKAPAPAKKTAAKAGPVGRPKADGAQVIRIGTPAKETTVVGQIQKLVGTGTTRAQLVEKAKKTLKGPRGAAVSDGYVNGYIAYGVSAGALKLG